MLNKSYCFKNRSTSSTTIIIIITAKYPKNFIYLLIITRIVLVTSLVLILVGGKLIIKSIINSNIGPYRICNRLPHPTYCPVLPAYHLYINCVSAAYRLRITYVSRCFSYVLVSPFIYFYTFLVYI